MLRRLDVEHDKRFLNAKNSTTATVHLEPNSGSFKKGLIPYNKGKKYEMTKEERKKYGRTFTPEMRAESSIIHKQLYANDPTIKQKISQTVRAQYKDPEFKKRHLEASSAANPHIGTIWINDGTSNKRINKEALGDYPNWSKGRLIPQSTKDLMRASRSVTRGSNGKFTRKEV